MLSDDVELHDWETTCYGKVKVVITLQNLFKSDDSIVIKPINIFSEHSTVVAELEILINDSVQLFVVDVIKFNESNEISAIRAYKQ